MWWYKVRNAKCVTHGLLLDLKWAWGGGSEGSHYPASSSFSETDIPLLFTLTQLVQHDYFLRGQLATRPSFCLTLRLLIFDPCHISIGAHAVLAYPAMTLTSHFPIDPLFPMTSDPTGSVLQPSGPSDLLHLPPISAPRTDYSMFRIFIRL